MAEVSIWEGEFRAGSIPRLCVKSGKTADASLTFEFATDAWIWIMFVGPIGGRRATVALPLTRRWRRIFVVFRSIAITTGLAAVIALFSTAAFTEAARPAVVGFAFGAIATGFVVYVLYAGLRPKGDVYATPTGHRWIRLRDVHARFVAAVDAMP